MAKDHAYAIGYNEFQRNLRAVQREQMASAMAEWRAKALREEETEAFYAELSKARVSDKHLPPGFVEARKAANRRKKAELEERRDQAMRTYGISDLRKLPRAGSARREKQQQAGRARRESFSRAKKYAAESRRKAARVRG